MKNVIKILLLALTCMATRCPDKESENCHTAIGFSNNSEKSLRVIDKFTDTFFSDPLDIRKEFAGIVTSRDFFIHSGEQNNRHVMSGPMCYEALFINERFSDTVYVYVFDAAVVDNTPWEIVAEDYLVLKRYDLSLEDLQRLDWQITYPPTEAMKDVKQYPPYVSEKGEFNGNTKEAETER